MKEEMILTKEKSRIVYGISICLMVFHHLFGFPERITEDFMLIFDFSFLHIETMIAYFGKVCVALYAFISGYGLSRKCNVKKTVWEIALQQLVHFYILYWLVFVAFIPYGIITGRISANWKDVIMNLMGVSSSFNAEWWYIKSYFAMLITFPVFLKIFGYLKKVMGTDGCILVTALFLIAIYYNTLEFRYVMVFYMGVLFSEEFLFEKLKNKRIKVGCGLFGLGIIFVVRTFMGGNAQYDIIIAPLMILLICNITENLWIKKYIVPSLELLGRYSVYIWLTHTFFAYYYFQKITFMPRVSALIFVWIIVMCVMVAAVLDKIYRLMWSMIYNKMSN